MTRVAPLNEGDCGGLFHLEHTLLVMDGLRAALHYRTIAAEVHIRLLEAGGAKALPG